MGQLGVSLLCWLFLPLLWGFVLVCIFQSLHSGQKEMKQQMDVASHESQYEGDRWGEKYQKGHCLGLNWGQQQQYSLEQPWELGKKAHLVFRQ